METSGTTAQTVIEARAKLAPRRNRGKFRWSLGHILRGALVVALGFVLLGAAGSLYLYHRLTATVTSFAGPHFNQNQNAVWLEHEWAGQPHSAAEYDTLAAQLQQERITYVFAHVGPLNSSGDIAPSLAPNATELAAALHARLPGIKVLAWIGQLEAASGQPADQTVNLANSRVRAHIEATANDFVRAGFDGVHYDIEPITNNNAHFLDLLIETRAALPAGAIISVSAEKWAPNAHIADIAYSEDRASEWWTSYYFAAVAAHVDQMAVMTYDSGMPTASAYEIFVQQETKHILLAVGTASHPPTVLIGIPTYTGNDAWFHDSAENMRTGLTGVVAGLNSVTDIQPFLGVAIYRLALTTPTDWQTYDQMWLGSSA